MKDKSKRGRPAGSKTRFPGIKEAAADLDVTPNHLWKVITGQRESAGLLERVRAQFPSLLEPQSSNPKSKD